MSVNHLTDDFSSTNPHKSQERKILDALLAANGAWVSALDLSKISLQYSARIHSIRKTLGFDVENRVERTLDGGKRGYFRIRQFVSVADRKAAENSPLLFPEGLVSGHRDDG